MIIIANNQNIQDYEQVLEKIVFDEEELEQLKISIREFSRGKIDAKHLKQLLLRCRDRIVNDVSQFLTFCIDRIKQEDLTSKFNKECKDDFPIQNNIQIQQELFEKNELLKIVADRVNNLTKNLKKS